MLTQRNGKPYIQMRYVPSNFRKYGATDKTYNVKKSKNQSINQM